MTDRKLEKSDIACIMRTESGRNFIRRVLEYTRFFENVYDSDTYEHARRAGRREVGVWLTQELIEAAPGEWQHLLKEYFDV